MTKAATNRPRKPHRLQAPSRTGADSQHTALNRRRHLRSPGCTRRSARSGSRRGRDTTSIERLIACGRAVSRLRTRELSGPWDGDHQDRGRASLRARSPNSEARSCLLADQLDPVAVGVADEADAVALGAAAGAVGGLLGLDAFGGEALQGALEVVDGEGDVVVAAADGRRSRRRGCRSAPGAGPRRACP